MMIAPLTLEVAIEPWSLAEPFEITGHRFENIEVVVARLGHQGVAGRGEAAGVYYRDDTARFMVETIERVRPTIESGTSRQAMRTLLPPGGARNALDCAMWDLEAKLTATPVWKMAGLDAPIPLRTTFTCGAAGPDAMARAALGWPDAKALKLKLTGVALDRDRVAAVRAARPDVWLGVDANQGFDRAGLEALMPALVAAEVALIEQPFPVGAEQWLDDLHSPIPIAADESAQHMGDLAGLVGRFDAVNIKLDKCGGLTEALAMVRKAREVGLMPMVGCMPLTSLGIAPAFLAGQLADIVDLDSPPFLSRDRVPGAVYASGSVSVPGALWGDPPT